MDEAFIYSPFSRHTLWNEKRRALLLQFILVEVFLGLKEKNLYRPPATFFPFDWSHSTGRLNKVEEHLELLFLAFPQMNEGCSLLKQTLKTEDLSQIFAHLKPFIATCHQTENLLPFLEKHAESVDSLCCYKTWIQELDAKGAR